MRTVASQKILLLSEVTSPVLFYILFNSKPGILEYVSLITNILIAWQFLDLRSCHNLEF